MVKKTIVGTVLCSFILSACGTPGGTIYKKDNFGPYNVLSLDARQRLVMQGARLDNDGTPHPVICSEPSPDAIAAQAAQIAASANVPVNPTQTAGGQLAGGFSESAASIAMRTQTIQLLRDGYYRLCEAYMNGVIERADYRDIVLFIDEFIATVVAIEAIGGTVQTAPVAITTNMSATVTKDSAGAVADQAHSPATFPATLTVNTAKADAEGAKQIALILERYYARKREYQMLMARIRVRR